MDGQKTTELRWHGRGGQGAVTSAEIIALAAIEEGKYAQAFPSFGPERRGAPVLAFNRIHDSAPIKIRSGVTNPDIVAVLDPGLLTIIDVMAGLKENGVLVINSPKSLSELKKDYAGPWSLAAVDATKIAKKELGVPIVNTTMLGAVVKALDGMIKLESINGPIKERFGARAQSNITAAREAYEQTQITPPVKTMPKRVEAHEVLPSWQEVLPGCVVTTPGNAKQYRTGDWRSRYPDFDYSRCIKCGLCYIFCPEGCIEQRPDGYFESNKYYCKGCGICAAECPKKVISMIEEAL